MISHRWLADEINIVGLQMRLSRFVAASFCVLGVTAFWVIKAQLVQSIESSGFSQPLFLSWAFTSCYSVLLIPALIWLWTRNQCAAQEVIIKQTVRSAFLLSFLYSLTSWLFNLSLSHTAGNLTIYDECILPLSFLYSCNEYHHWQPLLRCCIHPVSIIPSRARLNSQTDFPWPVSHRCHIDWSLSNSNSGDPFRTRQCCRYISCCA